MYKKFLYFHFAGFYDKHTKLTKVPLSHNGYCWLVSFQAGFPVLLGDRSTDGTHIFYRNATYIWTPVRKYAYYIVLVVADGQSIKTDFTSVSLGPVLFWFHCEQWEQMYK